MKNGGKETRTWSAERIKELTMSRINLDGPHGGPLIHRRRPLASIAVCAALLAGLSVAAYVADALGIRALAGSFRRWNVDEATNVLTLDTEGKTAFGSISGSGERCELTLKSMTLSPTGIQFSYAFNPVGGEAPLPSAIALRMSDGASVSAAISETSAKDGLLYGTALFETAVDLDNAAFVEFYGPISSETGGVGLVISVNENAADPSLPHKTP
jgi:hypothetical protein